MRHLLPLLPLSLLLACSGPAPAPEAPEVEESPAAAPASASADAQAVPQKIDLEAVANEGRTAMFVPAPSEFEAVLAANAAGLDLKSLVPSGTRSLAGLSKPLLALETGTRITAVLLTADAGDRPGLVARLGAAREGLVALAAGDAVLQEIDAFTADVQGGTLESRELTPALDVLSERIHDALHENTDRNTATLVQAGGWVQGAHLLARALGRGELTPDAAALFHQASLVHHFELFLKASDPARAGDPRLNTVIERMGELRWLAGQEALTQEQVRDIQRLTGEIIAAFRQAP